MSVSGAGIPFFPENVKKITGIENIPWEKNVSVYATSNRNFSGQGTFNRFIKPQLEKKIPFRQAFDQMGLPPAWLDKNGKELFLFSTQTPPPGAKIDTTHGPTRSPNAHPDSWVPGRPGELVLLIGEGKEDPQLEGWTAEKDHEGHLKRAQEFATDLQKHSRNIHVTILDRPTDAALESGLSTVGEAFGRNRKGDQVMIGYFGHAGYFNEYIHPGKTFAQQYEGHLFLREDQAERLHGHLSETRLKQLVNQKLSPNYDHVNVLLDACKMGPMTE